MNPLWQILILTQPSRVHYLARLTECLNPQIVPGVEIVVGQYDSNLSLGENRQKLIDGASADYINFVDDDDLVSPKYVATILPLLDGVDYVGFRLQMLFNGMQLPTPTYHSLRYGAWYTKNQTAYRDISHINPIRRELAIQARMEGGFGEDERWANAMRELGIVKTENYIFDTMYFYLFRQEKVKAEDGLEVLV